MAADITEDDFTARSSDVLSDEEERLRVAYAQAVAELERSQQQASVDDTTTSEQKDYSIHEVAGIGRYVIPRHTGWKALAAIIDDDPRKAIVANVDFSPRIYPAFDGIIAERFQSPYLLDPADDKFMSYKSLRDNIAAVRNFLLMSYFANTPEGMTPDKARAAIEQIAEFVGDGLYNNFLYLGLIPNHDRRKPFIDIDLARAKHGEGAQYIYKKILEQQRHSNWVRPFAAVLELFGAKADWKLPPANTTHFTDREIREIDSPQVVAAVAIENAAARVKAIEAQLLAIKDSRVLSNVTTDLDMIGDHLVYTAMHLDNVDNLKGSVRREAIDLAKNILKNLKATLGGIVAIDGLGMKPTDDMAALGAIKGVAMVYERLVAWAKQSGDSAIFQHPAVIAATQSLGQLGYIAKSEALRMARVARNGALADAIENHIRLLPESYKNLGNITIGELLEHIEQGMDTILNRTQQVTVTGAKVGFSRENTLGTTLDGVPVAGMSNQVGMEDAAQRNAAAAQADQLAAMAQAQRINAQMAAASRANQSQGQGQAQQAPAPASSRSTTGRQALRAAQQQSQQRQTTNVAAPAGVAPTGPLTAAQVQAMQRNAAMAAANRASKEREEQAARQQQEFARQQAAATIAKAKAAAAKIDPMMLKGFKNATSMAGVTGELVTGKPKIDPKSVQASMKPATPQTAVQTPPVNVNDPLKNPYAAQPPVPPRGGGRGY